MEYGRDTTQYKFAQPKEPTKLEDLYARGFSKKHRKLSDGKTILIKYSDSMRLGKDTRYNRATVPVMTEMYEMIPGKQGESHQFRRLSPVEFSAARKEFEESYKTAHLGAEDIASHSTGREVTRIRKRSAA